MTRRDAFWLLVYENREHLIFIQVFMLVLLLLSGFALLFISPESKSFAISIINVALICILGTAAGVMYWYSKVREQRVNRS